MLTNEIKKAFRSHRVVILGGAQRTADSYLAAASHYFTWHSEQSKTPCPTTTEQWLEHLYLYAGNKSNQTRACRLAGVRAVCKFMINTGVLESDPTLGVPSPKLHKRAAKKFSQEEMRLLFSAPDITTIVGQRDLAILCLFYATGLRRAEMCGLTLSNLHIGVRSGRVMVCGKGSKERTVSFEGERLIEILSAWLLSRAKVATKESPYVFVSIQGSSRGECLARGGMGMVIKRAGSAVGLDDHSVFLHKLRATYATSLYDRGMDLKVIQLLMGHGDPSTTMKYIAISERHLKTSRLPAAHINGLLP